MIEQKVKQIIPLKNSSSQQHLLDLKAFLKCPAGHRGQGVKLYSGRHGNVQECRFFHSAAADDGCGHYRAGNHQATARGGLEVSLQDTQTFKKC